MNIKQTGDYQPLEPAKIPHNYRILVVDDDEACAKMLMWTLEELGQIAQIALDGLTAISLAKSFPPDLILLDIGMPGMTGYEVCRTIRMEHSLKDTLIVAQTGWSETEHKERATASGFSSHLVKPIKIDALRNIISILDRARMESEGTASNNI